MFKSVWIKCLALFLNGALLISNAVTVAAVNEEELFSDGDFILAEEEIVRNNVDEELGKPRLGFSGEINTRFKHTSYSAENDWLALANDDYRILTGQTILDFFVDHRFNRNFRSFANVEFEGIVEDNSQSGTTEDFNYCIKEFFIDVNLKQKVYSRLGKQVLQWGLGYFWNPTDLINIDQKNFFDLDRGREGAYGIKAHIPYGMKKNVYLFLRMDEEDKTKLHSLSGKYEFLAGNTEMSFSAWCKENSKPVFGFNISGRLSDLDLRAELCVANEYDAYTMDYETLEITKEQGNLIPKACFGLTKYYDHGDIRDRIMVTGEFYYNGAGYEKNIIDRIKDNPRAKGLFMERVYQPYRNSKYYLALFSSIQKFIVPDLTLKINAIGNLADHSVTASCGIDYSPNLSDASFSLKDNGYFGDKNTEAKFLGKDLSISLGMKYMF